MNKIECLLKEVWLSYFAMKEGSKRFANQLAPDFKLLDFMPSDEMALSNYIAFLLNPKGTHGQGDKYLCEFLKLVGHPNWLSTEDLISCEVITEKQANGQRRIDIYLQFSNGHVAIENKPLAGDQNNQLSDYADFLQNNLSKSNERNWLLIYLSNSAPGENSITIDKREFLEQGGNFTIRDFRMLLNWLEICSARTQPLAVRVFIEELAKFVRININGELDMTSETEIKKIILGSGEYLTATFQIFNSMRSVKESLLKKLKVQLESIISHQNGWSLCWDIDINGRWTACSGFAIKFSSAADLSLRFEFCSSDFVRLEWGIYLVDKNIKPNLVQRQKIYSSLNDKFGTGYQSDRWPWYSSDLRLLSENKAIKDWYRNPLAWQMIHDGELAEQVGKLAQEVCSLFKDELSILSIEH